MSRALTSSTGWWECDAAAERTHAPLSSWKKSQVNADLVVRSPAMGPKHIGWRLALGALVLAGGAAAVVYATTCPKGFVRCSEYEDADTFGCIDYGGISTPQNCLQLRDEG